MKLPAIGKCHWLKMKGKQFTVLFRQSGRRGKKILRAMTYYCFSNFLKNNKNTYYKEGLCIMSITICHGYEGWNEVAHHVLKAKLQKS